MTSPETSEAEVEAAMRAFLVGKDDRLTAAEYVGLKQSIRAALTAAAQVRAQACTCGAMFPADVHHSSCPAALGIRKGE